MIEIVYDRMRLRLTADGHAGFAEVGQDIVCAAVTILVYTLAAAVGNMDAAGQARGSSVELGSGHAEIVCAASPRWHACAKMICDQICAGFDILRQMYPERVRYEVRG